MNITIFDRSPSDWRDLQNLVAQLFRELGCDVDVGRRIELVRGSKEVDVLVADVASTPPARYLVECKFWSRAVPLEVVHSFRTVVADSGAHRGFIVSLVGFQEGAHSAASMTNVELVTFDQLQAMFRDRWLVSMGRRYMAVGDALFPYWDYPGKMPKIPWTRDHVERQQALIEAYRPIVGLRPSLEISNWRWNLPMSFPSIDEAGRVTGSLTLKTYREVYDFIEAKKDLALRHFQEVYGEV